jgi:hypothetical protein
MRSKTVSSISRSILLIALSPLMTSSASRASASRSAVVARSMAERTSRVISTSRWEMPSSSS